jgi:arylformamidase
MSPREWDLESPIACSVVTRPHGVDVSAWGIPATEARPFAVGEFVAAISAGGSINCDVWTVTIHAAGTHTETVRHIRDEGPFVDEIHFAPLMRCLLLRVRPTSLAASGETYSGTNDPQDPVVTRAALQTAAAALGPTPTDFDALLLATGTIGEHSDARFDERPAPYLTDEAMTWVHDQVHVQHLLVDLPSVDRLWDGGRVSGHHLYWGVDADGVRTPSRTITEFVRVRADLPSGCYALQLSVAAWHADAAPSRVTLYRAVQP